MHLAAPNERRGKSFDSTHLQSRVELLLVETQAASQHSREATAHAIAAAQTLFNELRAAKAACVAAERAAHLAAGAISGAAS